MPVKRHLSTSISAILAIVVAAILIHSPLSFDFSSPLKQDFDDFDIYDLRFAGESNPPSSADSDIVIIQAGENRQAVVHQLLQIEKLRPKIIGVDLLFYPRQSTDTPNSQLHQLIQSNSNIITAYKISLNDAGKIFINPTVIPEPIMVQKGGFVNFEGHLYDKVRSFKTQVFYDSGLLTAFDWQVAAHYNTNCAKNIIGHRLKSEYINYSFGQTQFKRYSIEDFDRLYNKISSGELTNNIRGKLILLGVFDTTNNSLEDFHFTPLNVVLTGRTLPDMYGIFIHANIIKMMIQNRYILAIPETFGYLIGLILIAVFLWLVSRIEATKRNYNAALVRAIQIGLIILVTYIALECFKTFDFRTPLSPIIISLTIIIEIRKTINETSKWLRKILLKRV